MFDLFKGNTRDGDSTNVLDTHRKVNARVLLYCCIAFPATVTETCIFNLCPSQF